METLTLIRNVAGNIALFFIAALVLYYAYHMLKAIVVGWDLYKWRMIGADAEKMKAMGWKRVLTGKMHLYAECYIDTLGYNGSITYSRGGYRWEGYGTGR